MQLFEVETVVSSYFRLISGVLLISEKQYIVFLFDPQYTEILLDYLIFFSHFSYKFLCIFLFFWVLGSWWPGQLPRRSAAHAGVHRAAGPHPHPVCSASEWWGETRPLPFLLTLLFLLKIFFLFIEVYSPHSLRSQIVLQGSVQAPAAPHVPVLNSFSLPHSHFLLPGGNQFPHLELIWPLLSNMLILLLLLFFPLKTFSFNYATWNRMISPFLFYPNTKIGTLLISQTYL